MTKRFFSFSLIVFGFVFLVGCPNKSFGELSMGDKVAAVKLKTPAGKTVDLSKLGVATVVVFMAPDHEPSAKALNRIKTIFQDGKLKNVKVLAVTRGKEKDEINTTKSEFKKNKWPFAVAFDPDLKAARHFGVERPLPAAYIVGKDGRLKSMPIREFTKRIHSLTFKDMLIQAGAGKNIPRVDFEETFPQDGSNLALIGHAPPAFTGTDLKGRSWSPTMLKGRKNLLLVFWLPTCPHCKRELPLINKFFIKDGERLNVEVLTLTKTDEKNGVALVREVLNSIAVDFPTIVLDKKSKVTDMYFANRVPMLYFVNKNGVICDFLSGELSDTTGILKSVFEDSGRMNMK